MTIIIDETLPWEERDRIFRQAAEQAHEQWAKIVYDEAIKDGASVEEAAKLASEAKVSL